jgi:DNA repair protein RecO (recombination protein O)
MDKPAALVKAAFEWKAMCLAGYEPLLDTCAVCGEEPQQPLFNLSEGVLHCPACREEVGEGISMPLTSAALSALRHVAYGDPKQLTSFKFCDIGERVKFIG